MSKKFIEKQQNGILVEAAEWVTEQGKPDLPENWTRLRVRLEDKSRYTLSRDFVKNNKIDWIGK